MIGPLTPWRLDNGELAGVAQNGCVVQAGTNNLGDFESADARNRAAR